VQPHTPARADGGREANPNPNPNPEPKPLTWAPHAQVVDEKLWNSEDEDEGKDQGQDQKQEQYDDNGSIAVDDKKDLDYEVRPVLRIMLVLLPGTGPCHALSSFPSP